MLTRFLECERGPMIPFAAICVPVDSRLLGSGAGQRGGESKVSLSLSLNAEGTGRENRSSPQRTENLGLFLFKRPSPFAPLLMPACKCQKHSCSPGSDFAPRPVHDDVGLSSAVNRGKHLACTESTTPIVLEEAFSGRVKVVARSPQPELPELPARPELWQSVDTTGAQFGADNEFDLQLHGH